MNKYFAIASGILCGVAIIHFAIWCGVYFGIYYYFFAEYAPATCSVTGSLKVDNEPVRVLNVKVYKDGKSYPGFACEAESYQSSEVTYDLAGYYPYQFMLCLYGHQYDSCDAEEEIMPRWLCTEWSIESKFQADTLYDCKYILRRGSSGPLDDELLSESYVQTGYPFIEVIFKDEPFYPRDSYLTLMILCLGILCLLPFLLCLLYTSDAADE